MFSFNSTKIGSKLARQAAAYLWPGQNQNGEGGVGQGGSERNAPTKRSSGHKKLNPFFMTEAEYKRTAGRREGAVTEPELVTWALVQLLLSRIVRS